MIYGVVVSVKATQETCVVVYDNLPPPPPPPTTFLEEGKVGKFIFSPPIPVKFTTYYWLL